MKKPKLTYIVSDVDKALAFEWVALHLKDDFELFFILIGKENSALAQYLRSINVRYENISDEKYPTNWRKWLHLFLLLKREGSTIIHTHLWRATVMGLTAAWVLKTKYRIFTRHHATVHYREYPSGLKWDKLCNWLATDIVAVSENVKKILTEFDKVNQSKVHVIHHGFHLDEFQAVDNYRIHQLKEKYNIPYNAFPVVGVISRYISLKGIQYLIPAVEKLFEEFPRTHLILANAHGEYGSQIQKLLKALPKGSYTEIIFENDIPALYKCFSIFAHVPIDSTSEAFGQTYIEALAAGVPSVFTLSGIANEFISSNDLVHVVEYKSSDSILQALRKISKQGPKSSQGDYKIEDLKTRFDIKIMIDKLFKLYNR